MDDTGFKLNYTWEDLKPIRPLFVAVLVAQGMGAAASLSARGLTDWYEAAWFGGALATLPGYFVGLLVQQRVRPGSITSNRSTVLTLGAIALLLFVAALTFPQAAS